VRVAELLNDALNHAKGGHVIIYYRKLRDLDSEDYKRALIVLRALVRTCGCEVRAHSYKCNSTCVSGFLDGIVLKLRQVFGIQI